jgi:SAM-dependent methyltransferase
MSDQGDDFFEGFYKAFENMFRGSREVIKERLGVYAPFLSVTLELHAPACAIDLGCGRGEWLELLRDAGFEAQGVDLNEGMLADCRERHSDDWDWFMRARELQIPMLLHDDVAQRSRLHLTNMTRDRKAVTHFLPRTLKRSLDRRRANKGHRLQSISELANFNEAAKPADDDGK